MRRRDVILAGCASLATPAFAQSRWTFDRSASSIDMSVRAVGRTWRGRFADWTGDLVFDPDRLDLTRATMTVRSASLRMAPPASTARATGPSFLDAARHPTIRFELLSVRSPGGERYDARANVTMKGRTRPVSFPLDLRTTGDRAHLTGALTVDRANYGIGTSGPWDRLVGRQVTVRFALQARRA